MSDIGLAWNRDTLIFDFKITNEDLVTDEGLQSAINLSLFTQRAANAGDVMPDGSIAKGGEGGYWADELATVPGDKVGSRLWLLQRSKDAPDVSARAEAYVREALAWMTEDGVAERVDVLVESVERLAIEVTVFRPNRDPRRFRFDHAWDAEEERN